ncbi:hypothetical protein MKX01_018138 [Papaver californicum]|nr:hypothetical protein MKX01_018138 [Papaver californicum]
MGGNEIDLSGDGGVIKTIIRQAKPDATGPTESFPLVDVFDTTHEDNTLFSFEVGKGAVIKAWDYELKRQREMAAATKEEEKKKREEAEAAAAARVQAKMDAKKGPGKEKEKENKTKTYTGLKPLQ